MNRREYVVFVVFAAADSIFFFALLCIFEVKLNGLLILAYFTPYYKQFKNFKASDIGAYSNYSRAHCISGCAATLCYWKCARFALHLCLLHFVLQSVFYNFYFSFIRSFIMRCLFVYYPVEYKTNKPIASSNNNNNDDDEKRRNK